ncbi:hypothetical protein E2C01_038405 [Portunus trituberculatus]|uniref:Uncharacterized protein n=1 Tax=Portunus trituberculatus TaxID=210409 RepID=A0A5B7FH59_PORTR|nr:hypothetical protein [Portunus trituberculatus]
MIDRTLVKHCTTLLLTGHTAVHTEFPCHFPGGFSAKEQTSCKGSALPVAEGVSGLGGQDHLNSLVTAHITLFHETSYTVQVSTSKVIDFTCGARARTTNLTKRPTGTTRPRPSRVASAAKLPSLAAPRIVPPIPRDSTTWALETGRTVTLSSISPVLAPRPSPSIPVRAPPTVLRRP